MSEATELVIEGERVGAKTRVFARLGGDAIHADTLDLAVAASRERFVGAVIERLPQAPRDALEGELLRLADAPAGNANVAVPGEELDLSAIVRPEQFYTRHVSGMAVPVVVAGAGGPSARWFVYLRWADGRRERRELDQVIDLPDGKRLWVHPLPGEPSVTAAPPWSAAARSEWLGGAPAPDAAHLFGRLCGAIAGHIDFDPATGPGMTATLALWVLLTYGYRAFPAVPYLSVGGSVGSGKSRLFDVLGRLVFRPLMTANITGPAMFRTLHDKGGTVLFDEAERLRQGSPEVQELLSMLLSGYRRGGSAVRLEKVGDGFRPVEFDVYGPKALACIAGLPPTLASRCIPIMMFRAPPGSARAARALGPDSGEWQRLRDDLHALALGWGREWPGLPDLASAVPDGLGNRDRELWQPLLSLAALVQASGVDGLLSLVQQHALATVEANRDDSVPEADEVLLEVLAEAVKAGRRPTAGEILSEARLRDAATFDRWAANTVTRRLKNYGLTPPRKSNGERRYGHVRPADLRRIQSRYGIDLGLATPASAPPDPQGQSPTDPGGGADPDEGSDRP